MNKFQRAVVLVGDTLSYQDEPSLELITDSELWIGQQFFVRSSRKKKIKQRNNYGISNKNHPVMFLEQIPHGS